MDEEQKMYNLAVAALLHDIGKFFNDCGSGKVCDIDTFEGKSGSHATTSYLFIEKYADKLNKIGFDSNSIKHIVLRHHGGTGNAAKYLKPLGKRIETFKSKLVNIVHFADSVSSDERLAKTNDEFKSHEDLSTSRSDYLMSSVFNRYNRTQDNNNYTVTSLYGIDGTSPKNKASKSKNREVVKAFDKEFDGLVSNSTDKSKFIDELVSLLKKYTSCTTSAANEKMNDISLFNHLQTTAAIALAMNNVYTKSSEKILSLKDKQAFKMVRVHIENSDAYLKKGLMDFEESLEYAKRAIDEVVEKICALSKILSSTNTVINSDTDRTLLINAGVDLSDINELILKHWEETDGSLCIAVREREIIANEVVSAQGKEVASTQGKSKSWIEYLNAENIKASKSIQRIITSGGKWMPQDIKYDRIDKTKKTDFKKEKAKITEKYGTMIVFSLKENRDTIMKNVLNSELTEVVNGEIQVTDKIFNYTSISRYTTLNDVMNQLFKYNRNDSVMKYTVGDKYVVICNFSESLGVANTVLDRFNKVTCGKIEAKVDIETFMHSDEISKVYNNLLEHRTKSGISFNGDVYNIKEFDNIYDLYYNIIDLSEDVNSGFNSSLAYRCIEVISGKQRFLDTNDGIHMLCIPRIIKYLTKLGAGYSHKENKLIYEDGCKVDEDTLKFINNYIIADTNKFDLNTISSIIRCAIQ